MNENQQLQALIDESVARRVAHIRGRGAPARMHAFGTYWERVNGVLVGVHADEELIENTLPDEGIHHCLNVWLGVTAKAAGWYLGLGASAVNPASSWTAGNVAANAGEIVSTTQGYSGATRPQWTPNPAESKHIDNVGQEAVFNIVCTGALSIESVFLISDNARGGTAGKLASAARYPTTRILQNGDTYSLGYQVTLASA